MGTQHVPTVHDPKQVIICICGCDDFIVPFMVIKLKTSIGRNWEIEPVSTGKLKCLACRTELSQSKTKTRGELDDAAKLESGKTPVNPL